MYKPILIRFFKILDFYHFYDLVVHKYYYFAFTDKDHTINCPSCKKFYCLKCKTIKLTEDKFCAKCEYGNEDKAFVKFATDKKLKKCRVCGRVIERTEGCNHMTCKC